MSLPRDNIRRPSAWLAGSMHVAVQVDLSGDTPQADVVARARRITTDILGDIKVAEPEKESPPLLIPTLVGSRQLVFVPINLASEAPRALKQAVGTLNSDTGRRRFADAGLTLVGATPNWFGAAQDIQGGSPGSNPVPAQPYGSRIRYAPVLGALDLLEAAEHSAWAATGSGPDKVHIAVLDTAPGRDNLNWARAQFPANAHLRDVLQHLVPPIGQIPAAALEAARATELLRLGQSGGLRPIEPPEPFDIRDHGLFVAGVVLAAAPWVRMRLIRVLNNFGVGSLNSLLIALIALVQAKQPTDPLIINLSLGMLPALEQLPDVWFGFPIEGLPGCPPNPDLQFLPDGKPLTRAQMLSQLKDDSSPVSVALSRLQAPLQELMTVLLAHNCLVIAAAGNDSVFRGVERHPRWSPRIPARYDEVLGVAADTIRPTLAARYSNQGEFTGAPVRDAVATLGGDLAADGVSPTGGVINVYSARQFPPLFPPAVKEPNATGWAEWSGTSFATPIVSGIAANFWATYSDTATNTLRNLNAAIRFGPQPDVPDLGVPAVPVSLTWLP
jgi:hypothetical protein